MPLPHPPSSAVGHLLLGCATLFDRHWLQLQRIDQRVHSLKLLRRRAVRRGGRLPLVLTNLLREGERAEPEALLRGPEAHETRRGALARGVARDADAFFFIEGCDERLTRGGRGGMSACRERRAVDGADACRTWIAR